LPNSNSRNWACWTWEGRPLFRERSKKAIRSAPSPGSPGSGVKNDERISIATALKSAARLARIVDTRAGNEEPLYSVVEPANYTRDGGNAKICPLALNGELLKNAPACKGDYFKVAAVLE